MNRQLIEHVPDWGRTPKNEPKTGQGGWTKNVLKMSGRVLNPQLDNCLRIRSIMTIIIVLVLVKNIEFLLMRVRPITK